MPTNENVTSDLSSALAQLRLKLLDLTGRNRLLNFKHTAGKALQFVEGQPSDIYQKLVEGTGRPVVSILGLPDATRQDWQVRNGRLQRPEPVEWAQRKGIQTSVDIPPRDGFNASANVRALMYADDLAKHCRKIEREAILAIEETGANMLFLVLGFLDFPDQRDSDKIFAAPLVCIPVSLAKKEIGGVQMYSINYTGEDISENLSLREKLHTDHGLTLPDWNEDEIDIEQYFYDINRIIRNQPRFLLRRRVSLCLLSFTNMLMVRDLDPSEWQLKRGENGLTSHPIVKTVFEGNTNEDFFRGEGVAGIHNIEEGEGAKLPLVYDADSSQHSALIDILVHKKNLVIEGPPGTGKSQTITNLIASCLSEGKTVLFVTEKMAAIEVVRNRLALAGLDPFVLELHSNKSSKKRVLDELEKRITFRPRQLSELPALLQQHESYRKALKSYADLLNTVLYNCFGLTIHQIMWRAERHRKSLDYVESQLAQVTVADAMEMSEVEFSRRMDRLQHLNLQYEAIGGYDDNSGFWGFYPERIVPGEEKKLATLFLSSQKWVKKLIEDAELHGETLTGIVRDVNLGAVQGYRNTITKFITATNSINALHLIPGLFEHDRTGENTRSILNALKFKVDRYHELQPLVQSVFDREEAVDTNLSIDFKELWKIGMEYGYTFGNVADLRPMSRRINQAVTKLNSAMKIIEDFAKNREIPFSGLLSELEKLSIFAELLVNHPEADIHLQFSGLAITGAIQAIEALTVLQDQYVALEKEIDDNLYLDMLPEEEEIKQAIRTLREGDRWYRIFQSRWRSAVSLHKLLQRNKQKLPSSARLTELEKVMKLLHLKKKIVTDPSWIKFLGIPAPNLPVLMEGYHTLAKWHQSLKIAAAETNYSKIDFANQTADQVRSLSREFAAFSYEVAAAKQSVSIISGELKHPATIGGNPTIALIKENVQTFLSKLDHHMDWFESEVKSEVKYTTMLDAFSAVIERREIIESVDSNKEAKRLLADRFIGVDSDVSSVMEALVLGQSIETLQLPSQVKKYIRSHQPQLAAQKINDELANIQDGLQNLAKLERELATYGTFDIKMWTGMSCEIDMVAFAKRLYDCLVFAEKNADYLIPWSHYIERRKEALELGLEDFVQLLEEKRLKPKDLPDAYAYTAYSSIIKEAFRNNPQLGAFTGLMHNEIRDKFNKLDKEIIKLRGQDIAWRRVKAAKPPIGNNGVRVDDKTEMQLINHLLPQSRPRVPVRKMLTRAGDAIQTLKPCFMMGPQAVAQFLTPGALKFDIVIMDEASQLKPEEAIGTIARGKQLVVVGDPKQLPPTSFFSRMNPLGEEEEQFTTSESESILDLCTAHFRPTRSLQWHYRSQHHSLIAFSNHNFYDGRLVIFPSPYGQGGRLGVRATYLADAVYENQTNLREAKRVVDAAVEHIMRRADESLGIVTLNIKQRDLIAELLEERIRTVPDSVAYIELWKSEGQPLFIKNLENVQGDERDAIIISTTFGKPSGSNAVRQNFGPISRQGGWRRLNVLFTRAKKSVSIYTSLRPEDIVNDGSTPAGTKALRNYLEYAQTGSLSTVDDTQREPDSDFEIAIIDVLRQKGYEVTPQLGVAGYRIDIGVKHPDHPGVYLAAIECDGATYHSAQSVRDRDRIRQEILEALGWRGRIWRIWSTDWFRSPRQEMLKLISFIEGLRRSWKPEYISCDSWIEEGQSTVVLEKDKIGELSEPARLADESAREAINSALIENEDDLVIKIGDKVTYVDVTKPDDHLTVQISKYTTDIDKGIISEKTPLAQLLLEAVVGDEVTLHLHDHASRVFRIIGIHQDKTI